MANYGQPCRLSGPAGGPRSVMIWVEVPVQLVYDLVRLFITDTLVAVIA